MLADTPQYQQPPVLPVPLRVPVPPLSQLRMPELPAIHNHADTEERRHQYQLWRVSSIASMPAAMSRCPGSGGGSTRLQQPASHTWSHSSMDSDGFFAQAESCSTPVSCGQGTNDSVKSESINFAERLYIWRLPPARFSESNLVHGSFSSEGSDTPLPRLPEIDHISLESLASYYASTSTDRLHPRPVGYAPRATPRRYYNGNQPLPPICQQYQHQHQQQPQHHCHHYPTPSSSIPGYQNLEQAAKKPCRKSPARGTRCNVKYTIEQKDFIDYLRIDRETPWKDVVREFNLQFHGPKRNKDGLQAVFYRKNRNIPLLDNYGKLQFDEHGEVYTREVLVQAAMGGQQSMHSIGLLSTHPERAINYKWVTTEHKLQIIETAQARRV